MADEQYKWLNRETAERLLRGEPLEAVDPSARDQAERLSRALGALSAQAAPAPGELPGEQAALAAFRKVREAAEAERTAAAHAPAAPRTPARGTDAGLVRIGAPARTGIRTRRSRRGRPVRLALAAAVAAGTLGGVAVAAGSGVLPTPFDDEHPRPATSVSPDTTTGQPLASPSAPGDGSGTGAPDGGTRGRSGGTDDEAAGTDDGAGRNAVPGSGAPSATSGTGWLGAPAACRALRDGKDLDAGRKRALERLAGGPGRVTTYCKVLLGAGDSASGGAGGANSGGSGGNTTGQGSDNGKGEGKDGGKDGGKGKGDDGPAGPGGGKGNGKDAGKGGGKGGSGKDGGKDSGKGGGKGGGGKAGGLHRDGAAPAPSAYAPAHPGASGNGSTTASPTPTYTAL
ncbi:hypothetical protein HCJ76_21275 [Streptomyces sp. MC1]|uniref:hypothetical protein n=1 Tax=Streptomyces sp. MC1 TaxID=295105 RepID=UPI0018CB2E15|nr:hypothetical protein [Streptomyces sp. MC1]MBG7700557.1 hypothetical protein [Streptomyces sp. MC1]